ncbi:hypothetical protein [Legionella resiliens]|uniref:Uncharacterized protein n=1 Tax=Legionella resiliens TaxID=2905958 RepID=A0ABS8X228_9GAMM|nr:MULTISPECIES: hypothetical protein [unclassified Legionella]MCE0722188.1 hypothetical protein [Legionella sp. 9fVS26]MCE3531342.1 hypothetical protein [Legionella sp. 8cVS16]
MAVLFPLSIVPATLGFGALAVVASVILLPTIAIYGAYTLADQATDRLAASSSLNNEPGLSEEKNQREDSYDYGDMLRDLLKGKKAKESKVLIQVGFSPHPL